MTKIYLFIRENNKNKTPNNPMLTEIIKKNNNSYSSNQKRKVKPSFNEKQFFYFNSHN